MSAPVKATISSKYCRKDKMSKNITMCRWGRPNYIKTNQTIDKTENQFTFLSVFTLQLVDGLHILHIIYGLF